MKIKIMGKMNCIQYTFKKEVKPCIIISIGSDSNKKTYLKNHPNILDVLYLTFSDVEPHQIPLDQKSKLMNKSQAKEVKDFLDKWKDESKLEEIIVHCHAGVSRSSAVASGICLLLNQEDMWIWDNDYEPNHHVFRMMNTLINLTEEEVQHRFELNRLFLESEKYSEIEDLKKIKIEF